MALGTNYCRNPSGIYDLAVCYKMAVLGNNENKKKEFKEGIEKFKNVSETIRNKVLKDIAKFEQENNN